MTKEEKKMSFKEWWKEDKEYIHNELKDLVDSINNKSNKKVEEK